MLKTPHLLDAVLQEDVKRAMRVAFKLSLEDFIYEGSTDLEHNGLSARIQECQDTTVFEYSESMEDKDNLFLVEIDSDL